MNFSQHEYLLQNAIFLAMYQSTKIAPNEISLAHYSTIIIPHTTDLQTVQILKTLLCRWFAWRLFGYQFVVAIKHWPGFLLISVQIHCRLVWVMFDWGLSCNRLYKNYILWVKQHHPKVNYCVDKSVYSRLTIICPCTSSHLSHIGLRVIVVEIFRQCYYLSRGWGSGPRMIYLRHQCKTHEVVVYSHHWGTNNFRRSNKNYNHNSNIYTETNLLLSVDVLC